MSQDQNIIKKQSYGKFNILIIKEDNNYSVKLFGNGKELEHYYCETYDLAVRDYNSISDTVRNVLAMIREFVDC